MFAEMGDWMAPPALEDVRALNATYGIDEDFESIGRLCEQFGLAFPI